MDANYGVYEGTTFKTERFAAYLERHHISWPLIPYSGAIDLKDETFRQLAKTHSRLSPLRELQTGRPRADATQ